MSWTHRPTWPDHRATDRLICLEGRVIARVYAFEDGPQAATWGWFGQWIGTPNSGVVPTLAEALEMVRATYQRRTKEDRRVPIM